MISWHREIEGQCTGESRGQVAITFEVEGHNDSLLRSCNGPVVKQWTHLMKIMGDGLGSITPRC